MRFSRTLILAAFTFFATFSASAESNPDNSTSSEIRTLLKQTFSENDISGEMKLHITFMLNEQNEIMVISTSGNILDREIKSRLNHQIIQSTDLKKGHKYTLPVVIKK